jgi:hypothetical protein
LDVTPDNLGEKGDEFEGKRGVDEYIIRTVQALPGIKD